jgi:hypothetical protein
MGSEGFIDGKYVVKLLESFDEGRGKLKLGEQVKVFI